MKKEFLSQVCTTRKQSLRLLELGVSEETADMWYPHFAQSYPIPLTEDDKMTGEDVPAWSLNRLIELMPGRIKGPVIMDNGKEVQITCYLRITKGEVTYWYFDEDGLVRHYERFIGLGLYENVINIIEFLLSEDMINEEYLCNICESRRVD